MIRRHLVSDAARDGARLREAGNVSHIHIKQPKGKPMSDRTTRTKAEHPLAIISEPMLLLIRTIGVKRPEATIRFTAMACNTK